MYINYLSVCLSVCMVLKIYFIITTSPVGLTCLMFTNTVCRATYDYLLLCYILRQRLHDAMPELDNAACDAFCYKQRVVSIDMRI